MPAGKFRSDHVPGKLEQLHARKRVGLRRLPVGLKVSRQIRVVHDRDIGRHLEYAATAQFAQIIDELAVILRAPFQRAIHHPPVETDIAFRAAGPAFVSVDLAVDHAGDHRLLR